MSICSRIWQYLNPTSWEVAAEPASENERRIAVASTVVRKSTKRQKLVAAAAAALTAIDPTGGSFVVSPSVHWE